LCAHFYEAKLSRMKKLLGHVASMFRVKSDGPKSKPKPEPPQPTPPAPSRAPFVAFQPHNEIEQMLMEAATKPEAREAFERALLEADLYAATPEASVEVGTRTLSQGERVGLLNVQGPDGAPVAAVFTAQERIVEVFGMGVGFIAMKGDVLLDIVASSGAWLNPGFPYSVHWKPEELGAVLGKPMPRTVKKDTQIMLGTPAEPPIKLIESLQAVLGHDSRIAEAWFALAHWPEDGKSSWYLDVRTDLDGAVVQSLLAQTFKQADYAGRPLDMVVNKPGHQQGAGIRIAPLHIH